MIRESSVSPPSPIFPEISEVVTSLALITLSPDSSVISVELVVAVSTVIDCVVVAVFPAVSVVLTSIVCSPSPSALSTVIVQFPSLSTVVL